MAGGIVIGCDPLAERQFRGIHGGEGFVHLHAEAGTPGGDPCFHAVHDRECCGLGGGRLANVAAVGPSW
jgi:hypothetical protein